MLLPYPPFLRVVSSTVFSIITELFSHCYNQILEHIFITLPPPIKLVLSGHHSQFVPLLLALLPPPPSSFPSALLLLLFFWGVGVGGREVTMMRQLDLEGLGSEFDLSSECEIPKLVKIL